MEKAVIVRGRLSDPTHVELDEAVTDVAGTVEVVLRQAAVANEQLAPDIFELIAALPPGTRTRAEIDAQVLAERASWGDE